jgi:hypothetical protein
MARRDLLPGVNVVECPPRVVFDSRRAIRRARRRAAFRDAAQLILLAGVDYLFMHWPLTHIPDLGRDRSVLIVATLNSLILTHVMVSRIFPRWSARRIAATWCSAERSRFFRSQTGQQAR